jgi:PKD repeat protein
VDLRADPTQVISTAQGSTYYDAALLRWDSTRAGALNEIFQSNGATPGRVNWLGFLTGTPKSGLVSLARMYFTVIAASGSAETQTQDLILARPPNDTEFQDAVLVVEGTLTIGGGGGGGNQPPAALANVPATGTAGVAVAVSGAGSSDPDGSVASYTWDWGDGTAPGSGAAAAHVYGAAGSYTVTLTVTDNQGATDSDSRGITIAPAAPTKPFTLSYTFGPVIPPDTVPVTIRLNLTTDIPETPTPVEALAAFTLDSIKLNAGVLQYANKVIWGPASCVSGGGSLCGSGVAISNGAWVRILNGTVGSANSTGTITLAILKYRRVGASGASATTQTFIGSLTGTAATGPYDYRPRTAVTEGSYTVP